MLTPSPPDVIGPILDDLFQLAQGPHETLRFDTRKTVPSC
jgi:hypothetical protein